MRVHLVNPSYTSFGIGVITPLWLYVLAAATPAEYGDPFIADETLEGLLVQPCIRPACLAEHCRCGCRSPLCRRPVCGRAESARAVAEFGVYRREAVVPAAQFTSTTNWI